MKKLGVHELLNSLRLHFQENDITKKYAKEQPPLRAELFNVEQLGHHGRHLASLHQIKKTPVRERLLGRLSENEKILGEVRDLLTEATKDNRLISPAGEWLLDNFYLIEENIHTGKRHLPKKYSDSLPKLANTASADLPRVYAIALDIISHTDGHLNIDGLQSFVEAYQEIVHLQIGELWAVPIMLRLALIENLRRVAVRIALDRINQNLAGYWATQMINTAEQDPKNLILIIADMARSGPPLESSFVAELMRQLIWKGPGLTLPLTWMEQRLFETGLTSTELVNRENQKQAADQVSISNSINSLRFMGSIDWRQFVEELSVVERRLRQDSIYPLMDFTTRDTYRHVVERIAKNSPLSENEVASITINLAKKQRELNVDDDRQHHVGYYLVGEGVAQTEKLAHYKPPADEGIKRFIRKHPLWFYAGAIVLLSSAVAAYFTYHAYLDGISGLRLVFIALVALVAASHIAMALVNWWGTLSFKPGSLPRLDFSGGIPANCATMVVVPTMLNTTRQTDDLIEMLEVRFLANRDKNLHFALLTDFKDANAEVLPDDVALLESAQKRIADLNRRYDETGDKFFLFHRPRKWNAREKLWMGYERKRGKLAELNALLRGRGKDNFSLIAGDTAVLPQIRYVITLDTDTLLPHDAGWKLTGTMAHPLNKPLYSDTKKRIVKGHAILQPRVSVSLSRKGNSLYSLMHGNEPGIDPYTRLTSDIYQDLFDEGSFIGKGIYDVDAFETALNGRFPENRILSHDLLEGCYTRSGLLTDVQFYEEYPTHYSADVNRRHRWIRGDWQIGYWALPLAPDGNRRLKKNTLSALSRWKIFDNLRRSLVPAALTLLMALGWLLLPAAVYWTVAILLVLMLPTLTAFFWSMINKSQEFTLKQHLFACISSIAGDMARNAFMFICLPYEAFYSVDAIVRTLWRLFISRRKLLEWNPSGNQEHTSDKTLSAAYASMWFSPFFAAIVFALLVRYNAGMIPVAAPVLLLWAMSPVSAWWLSRPFRKSVAYLSEDQTVFLRTIARKTWAFFETFVTGEDNWLPPDNYQPSSKFPVAHRTSPTNIGIYTLASLSAYDFGFIMLPALVRRISDTLNTLSGLERYQGHFFNWYDTVTLKPLHPRYVSTVDSGNMAGHLLTLRQGLISLPSDKINFRKVLTGFTDTIRVIERYRPGDGEIKKLRASVENTLHLPALTAGKILEAIHSLHEDTERLSVHPGFHADHDLVFWLGELTRQCDSVREDILFLHPWLSLQPPAKFRQLAESLQPQNLEDIVKFERGILAEIKKLRENEPASGKEWLDAFYARVGQAGQNALDLIISIAQLERHCTEFADIDYDFLYDKTKNLLAIGYNVDDHKRDNGYYDLLASEASLSVFVAIAQGKLPQESWFALGRLLAYGGGDPLLLSWSGSMFEYLMPMLVMPEYENTLIHQTHKSAVEKQMRYGEERNVPWGISESGYNAVDVHLNYQYKAFGVPGTGLKRGLAEDLVIAPYASALALMVAPHESCRNLERISSEGFEGRFGFYEAVDYTLSRLPRGQSRIVVQSFMAHHQAMSLLSLAYVLLNQPMQKRFESELQFRAALLLLQERVPKTTAFYTHSAEDMTTPASVPVNTETRVIHNPSTPIPEVQLLSNGRYHVMVTNAGGGYSKWRDIGITRWKEDTTCDNWGAFCYIRDLETGDFWSNTYQPTLKQPKHYEATFSQGRAEFRREDSYLETYTEIVVSPEDDIEMRRIRITNRSKRERTIDITTYGEVVLSNIAADNHHPAFSKLFVNTEIVPQRNAIICNRRPRAAGENIPYLFHTATLSGVNADLISFETDRMEFIGRGNTLASPAAMRASGALSGSEGPVLDPIVAIRHKLTLGPEDAVVLDVITGICPSKDGCTALLEKYREKNHKDRVFELAWTHSQVVLRQINATESDAQLYGQLASSVIFTNPQLRSDPSVITRNRRDQSGLWGYSISGDLPIILLEIEDASNLEMVKQLVQAHAYLRLKGVAVDLVIWNEDRGGYRQTLQNDILGMVTAGMGSELTDYPGGIFVRAAEQMSEEDRMLFRTVARINISDKKGTLLEQLNRKQSSKPGPNHIVPQRALSHADDSIPLPADLLFFNGYGGFAAGGKEYVIVTSRDKRTPLPWVNVLANPEFGTVISESGQAYTWIENAHELRLSPWDNDPVSDKGGEAFYIRDEETGYYWSPAPLPVTGTSAYVTHHGFGYSVFRHKEDGVESEMTVYVDAEAPVKFFSVKLKNDSGRQRQLSVTGYIEWVLGDYRSKTGQYIFTEIDEATGAMIAKNAYNPDFADRLAFFDVDEKNRTFTGDRTDFIGRNRNLSKPEAMTRVHLSGRIGAAIDPCGALQAPLLLLPGQEYTLVFRLGCIRSNAEASDTIRKLKGLATASDALERIRLFWREMTGRLQVETTDPALDVITNGWLMYQTVACRLWARSGYYQSGGAYGFRDQLQDVLAVMLIDPAIARKQIILCASHQFKEGDVQHWWHPPQDRGVRTRCSDDLLWLPYATCKYVARTGDRTILDENIKFIEGRLLNVGEASYYDLPVKSAHDATLYEHCVRAIDHSLQFGAHGLPLIGHGDWNDGMDLVGKDGKGESVWLAFFLYSVLRQFSKIARGHGDDTFAKKCITEADQLRGKIEENAWDGSWYRRAYFDDGTPLGSSVNEECRIDSISQSWAVLSGAGDRDRIHTAIGSADQRLVNSDAGIIQLLTPPFDSSTLNPGYIKGYVPGIRENGGQYTHAAVWLIMAHACLGHTERVWELLNMVNPVNHGRTPEDVATYKAEPYVMAADVYSTSYNSGRGGWTWYTGSAGWMYQLIIEWLLGFQPEGNRLIFRPCIPSGWESFKILYRFKDTRYHITTRQTKEQDGRMTIELDGIRQDRPVVELVDDGADHKIVITVGKHAEQYAL